jgi:opacity protein-like surface antigen
MRGKVRMFPVAGLFVLVIAVIASVSALAQQTEPVQLAANTTAPAISKPAAEIVPSTSALQARIDAQQQEINKLNALVERLEYMLQPVASNHAILPGSSIGFLPYPSPSPAPSSPPVSSGYMAPRELLPDIGQIGSQLGFFVGGATNPYKADKGFASGGYIDLPWKNVPGGKLSYEIMIGLQRSVTSTVSTSGVNALVNATINNYLNAAGVFTNEGGMPGFLGLTGYLAGPLNTYQQPVVERAKVLTVAPFELKYAITKFGRFRPYGVVGVGGYVWIGSDNNTKSFDAVSALNAYGLTLPTPITGLASLPLAGTPLTLGSVANALLQGSQIGGLAPTSPELAARGVPHGQGNLLFGGQIGGGADIRISPRLSMGFDFRHNQVEGKNASFNTFAFKQGLNW